MPVCRWRQPARRSRSPAAAAAVRSRCRSPTRCARIARVDRCPVCSGGDFYIRKDFDPKVGLAVVIVGALISAGFYWYGRDLIAYSILGFADADRSGDLRPAEGSDRLLPLPQRVPRRVRAQGGRVRSSHRGRARDGIRAADRAPIATVRRASPSRVPLHHALIGGDLDVAVGLREAGDVAGSFERGNATPSRRRTV